MARSGQRPADSRKIGVGDAVGQCESGQAMGLTFKSPKSRIEATASVPRGIRELGVNVRLSLNCEGGIVLTLFLAPRRVLAMDLRSVFRLSHRTWRVAARLLFLLFCLAPSAGAQDIVKEALASFPPQTIRVEYSRPAKLRELPDYQSLRTHYAAESLRSLEVSLSKLGVEERSIDELVLGWQAGDTGMTLEGLAAGHFNPGDMARRAAAEKLTPASLSDFKAYCFGEEPTSTCVVAFDQTRGAFGPLSALRALVEARQGSASNISSDSRFSALVNEARTDDPIWGAAIGQAVADWFKGWMPQQQEVELDWSKAFDTVESLSYSVQTADKARLNMRLNCTTLEAAANLRQVLNGLRMFQQLAWQNKNPGHPNPFESLAIDAKDRQVLLTLTTAYSALEGAAL